MKNLSLVKNGAVQGPFSQNEVEEFLKSGKIDLETVFKEAGSDNWAALKTVGWAQIAESDFSPSKLLSSDFGVQYRVSATQIIAGIFLGCGMIGVGFCLSAYNVSVATESGQVVNIGLISDRLAWLVASVGAVLFGAMLLILDAVKSLSTSKPIAE